MNAGVLPAPAPGAAPLPPAGAEQPLLIDCAGTPLVGVLHAGTDPAAALGVLVIVGGPQVRAGSHRQFVQLARALAGAGVPVLRFDVRGMGDSPGALRSFEQLHEDIAAAHAALARARPGLRGIVLWGLCDAASAALLYLDRLQQPPGSPVPGSVPVAGCVLLNPWARSAASLAQTHVKHYYRERLRDPAFWRKLLGGGVGLAALRGYLANRRLARGRPGTGQAADTALPFQERMARGWHGFAGRVLLLLCEADLTAREFSEYTAASPRWQEARRRRPAEERVVPEADHTCSTPAARAAVEAATLRFVRALGAEAR